MAQPNTSDLLRELVHAGNRALGQDRPLDALAYYERALAIDPTFDPAWYAKGMALLRLGRVAEADEAAARGFEAAQSAEAAERRARLLDGQT